MTYKKSNNMRKTSKKYTKKQIQESIRYWQKQLKLGNYISEEVIDGRNRLDKPMRRVIGDNGIVTVGDLLDAAGAVYDGQERVPLNVGEDGMIYGQVNQVKGEHGKCVLTLAPYKNGSRSRDLSVDGCRNEPLRLPEVIRMLQSVPKDYELVVKMKDPYGFGPSANTPIECAIEAIDVDSAYGMFLRTSC